MKLFRSLFKTEIEITDEGRSLIQKAVDQYLSFKKSRELDARILKTEDELQAALDSMLTEAFEKWHQGTQSFKSLVIHNPSSPAEKFVSAIGHIIAVEVHRQVYDATQQRAKLTEEELDKIVERIKKKQIN